MPLATSYIRCNPPASPEPTQQQCLFYIVYLCLLVPIKLFVIFDDGYFQFSIQYCTQWSPGAGGTPCAYHDYHPLGLILYVFISQFYILEMSSYLLNGIMLSLSSLLFLLFFCLQWWFPSPATLILLYWRWIPPTPPALASSFCSLLHPTLPLPSTPLLSRSWCKYSLC